MFSSKIDLKKDIADLKTNVIQDIRLIKEKMAITEHNMSKQVTHKKTYANVTGEIVVIKPKNSQGNDKTKSDIKNKLNPSNLEVGIKEIKNVKDGGILIKCSNKTEVDKLKTEAQKKLNKNYVIKTYPKRKRTM
ncbi:hypothetical protein QE152_g21820 [Popillia japonica]|uniref:Uncharacterized protein n=1 Tax=Popillia japonica TaxID=7064 RepID=A0AAW1KKN7_POPJA